MTEVVKFYPANWAEVADNILEASLGKFSEVLVLGYDPDGNMTARATLGLKDGGDMIWLIEQFKAKLINGDYAGDE